MTSLERPLDASKTVLVLALVAAFGPAHAQTSVAEGSVSVGIAGLSGDRDDRAQFGQYNGLRTRSSVGLLGVEYDRRNPEAGTSVRLGGSNLSLATRELDFSWARHGDWKLGAQYAEGVRHEPYTTNTGLIGAGTPTPQVVPLAGGAGTGSDLDLKIKRTSLGLALWKSLGAAVEFEASLKSEDREGARLFGSGMSCPSTVAPGCRGATGVQTGSAVLLLPEPIEAKHSQIEARLSYAGEKLRLSVGYYGSFYDNAHGSLSPGVPAALNNPVGTLLPLNTGLQALLNLPLALPPDNQAHHLDLTGSYAFSPTTRASFKLGVARALQHQNFAAAGLIDAPAGVADLGGKVHTTLAQFEVTSRPTPKLSLLAQLRWEDKDDRTPIALYNIEGTSTYTNRQLPLTRTRAKLQAGYRLANDYRATVSADFESIDRGVFTPTSAVAGISALRRKTDETGVRAELRRTMSETFSAAISVEHARRKGSNWLKDNSGLGVTEVIDPNDPASGFDFTSIFSPSLADRTRDKVKLVADWQPRETLSLQFIAEDGKHRYSAPSGHGLQSTRMGLLGVDWDYAWSDKWRLNGHASQGKQRLHQSRHAGYILSFKNTSSSVGLGMVGKPGGALEVGAGLSHIDDKDVYAQGLDAFASADDVALLAATGGLPDVVFRQTTLRLFGKVDIDKRSAARVELVHQRSRPIDWAWDYNGVPFAYSDGTTLRQRSNQAVTMIGVTYTYRWR